MPIPPAVIFKRNTSPMSRFVGYGVNMAEVLVSLETYWENRNNGQEVVERLLYNLWKESCHWLEKKAGKTSSGELFVRRKLNVQLLRDAAMEELMLLSPRVANCARRLSTKQDQWAGRSPPQGPL